MNAKKNIYFIVFYFFPYSPYKQLNSRSLATIYNPITESTQSDIKKYNKIKGMIK